jgi:hypothetical protein
MSTYRDPASLEEWRMAATTAAGLRLIADAQMYGFITGGHEINVERCDEILERAAKQGIVPTAAEAEQAALSYVAQVAEAATC